MKIKPKYLLEGGEMPQGGAPEQLAADPLMLLAEMAAQALQTQDPNMAMQVCQGLVELASGGAPAPEGEPVFKAGGKLAYRIKK